MSKTFNLIEVIGVKNSIGMKTFEIVYKTFTQSIFVKEAIKKLSQKVKDKESFLIGFFTARLIMENEKLIEKARGGDLK